MSDGRELFHVETLDQRLARYKELLAESEKRSSRYRAEIRAIERFQGRSRKVCGSSE